jgi:hypothetical protein
VNDDDDRIWFFFEHERQIREWCALVGEAADFLNRFLASLADDFTELAAELREDVNVHDESAGNNNEILGLARQSWWGNAEAPRAVIAVRWKRNQVSLVPKGLRPIVGVRVDPRQDGGEEARKLLVARLSRSSDFDDFRGPPRLRWWPAVRGMEPPAEDYWQRRDLEPYRRAVVAALADAWRRLADDVDAVLG